MAHTLLQTSARYAAILLLAVTNLAACGGGGSGQDEQPRQEHQLPAGVQINNDYGVVQIDQDYSNHLLVSKGRGVTYAANGMAMFQVPYAGTGTAPILCLKPVNGFAFLYAAPNRNQAGNWTIAANAVGVSVDWYLFDANVASQDVGPGLSVYDANGRLAYNSSQRSLNVVSQLTTPASDGAYQFSQNVGGDYAICQSVVKAMIAEVGAPYAIFYGEGYRIVNNVFQTDPVNYGTIPWNGPSQVINAAPSVFTLVDVAGF